METLRFFEQTPGFSGQRVYLLHQTRHETQKSQGSQTFNRIKTALHFFFPSFAAELRDPDALIDVLHKDIQVEKAQHDGTLLAAVAAASIWWA